MSEDQLPFPANGDRDKLPVNHNAGPARPGGGSELSLDLLDDGRRDPDEIDLLAYWKILVKRRWLIVSCVAGLLLLALLLTLLTTPRYRATAVIQIEKQSQQIVQGGDLVGPTYGWDPEFLATQIGLLKSQALVERVADDLDIDQATLDGLRPPG